MLTNPLLQDMSVPDLTQRYGNCWMQYNGNFVQCHHFKERDRFINTMGKDVAFDWRYLNTERILTGWYQKDREIMYMYYLTNRQFHRGYCPGNTTAYYPDNGHNFPDEIFKYNLQPTTKRRMVNVGELKDTTILSRRIAFHQDSFFYKTKIVAVKHDDIILLKNANFKTELTEVLRNPKFITRTNQDETQFKKAFPAMQEGGEGKLLNVNQINWDVAVPRRAPRFVARRNIEEDHPIAQEDVQVLIDDVIEANAHRARPKFRPPPDNWVIGEKTAELTWGPVWEQAQRTVSDWSINHRGIQQDGVRYRTMTYADRSEGFYIPFILPRGDVIAIQCFRTLLGPLWQQCCRHIKWMFDECVVKEMPLRNFLESFDYERFWKGFTNSLKPVLYNLDIVHLGNGTTELKINLEW